MAASQPVFPTRGVSRSTLVCTRSSARANPVPPPSASTSAPASPASARTSARSLGVRPPAAATAAATAAIFASAPGGASGCRDGRSVDGDIRCRWHRCPRGAPHRQTFGCPAAAPSSSSIGSRRRSVAVAVSGGGGATQGDLADVDLGPASDLLSALDALSYTRTFSQLCTFLEHNSHLFRGPEVAALVLQAANVSELAAHRQLEAAMAVAERRAAAMEAEGDAGGMTPEILAGAVSDWLSAAGPSGGGGDSSEAGGDVLEELDAADQMLGWATPVLRAHIKRYTPDAVAALVSALAQLEQYDQPLMELVADAVKADPRGWLRRAAVSGAMEGEVYEADGSSGEGSTTGSDPWVVLTSLVRAFARLGHYDRELMAAVAQQAVELMPSVVERAELADVDAAGGGSQDGGSADSAATDTVVALVSSFYELNHLEPRLMQAVGEYLAAFAHQLDAGTAADALLAFATFNARNPAFYSLLLRRVVEAPPDSLTPRTAGALYRACVLIGAMGEVPALAPPAAPGGGAETEAEVDRAVGAALAQLLSACLAAFPPSELRAARLGRPEPDQLAAADEELVAAWEATGLMTVPQVLEALGQLPVEVLPAEALVAGSAASPQGTGGAGSSSGAVIGALDVAAWVPADALVVYGGRNGSGARIAIKALNELVHCCQNMCLEPGAGTGAGEGTDAYSTPRPRIRGPAFSELRCLEAWSWRVLLVPVGCWAGLDEGSRVVWLARRLAEAAEGGDATPVGPELRM